MYIYLCVSEYIFISKYLSILLPYIDDKPRRSNDFKKPGKSQISEEQCLWNANQLDNNLTCSDLLSHGNRT